MTPATGVAISRRKPIAMTSPKRAARPPVHMIDSEADALSDLALRTEGRNPEVSALLIEESTRAKINSGAKIPADVVTMHPRVEFVEGSRSEKRRVRKGGGSKCR